MVALLLILFPAPTFPPEQEPCILPEAVLINRWGTYFAVENYHPPRGECLRGVYLMRMMHPGVGRVVTYGYEYESDLLGPHWKIVPRR
jgi:hypothetical protein